MKEINHENIEKPIIEGDLKEDAQALPQIKPAERVSITSFFVISLVLIYIITSFPTFTEINPFFLQWGAFESNKIDNFELWRLITSNLLHSNLRHLFLNCISIAIWGFMLEKSIGKLPFIILIVFSAIFTDYFTYIFMPGAYSIGASGIAYGMMFGFIVYLLGVELLVNPEIFKKQIVSFVVLVIFQILANFYGDPHLNIWGHLGGSLAGIIFMIMYIIIYRNRILQVKDILDQQEENNHTKNE